MKKLFFIGMLIPVFSLAQKPTVVQVSRFFPKMDKVMELEKALKNHAQKYHTGDFKWRAYTVESGPDAGGYQMIEGPSTWTQLDKRGDISAEHNNDLFKNVLPNTERSTEMFITYREDLSSIPLTEFSDKIMVIRVFPKVGKSMQVENDIRTIKKMWDAAGQNVAIYQTMASGHNQYIIVYRFKQGFKDLDAMKPLPEAFDAAIGAGSFEKWQASINENTEDDWSEFLSYNADLSSK